MQKVFMDHSVQIKNINHAKGYISALVAAGKDFHFDDDPADVIDYGTGERVFTDEEAKEVCNRLDEMADLDWDEHECPIGYVLHLQEEKLHQAARDFMETHTKADWVPLSLDEWLVEHADQLSDDVRRAGYTLLAQF